MSNAIEKLDENDQLRLLILMLNSPCDDYFPKCKTEHQKENFKFLRLVYTAVGLRLANFFGMQENPDFEDNFVDIYSYLLFKRYTDIYDLISVCWKYLKPFVDVKSGLELLFRVVAEECYGLLNPSFQYRHESSFSAIRHECDNDKKVLSQNLLNRENLNKKQKSMIKKYEKNTRRLKREAQKYRPTYDFIRCVAEKYFNQDVKVKIALQTHVNNALIYEGEILKMMRKSERERGAKVLWHQGFFSRAR